MFNQQHGEVHETAHEHKGKLSHELIAGAASYEAVKAYQKHCEEQGKPSDHATAKALLAGFAGAALDKLIETKGLDFIDEQKAKRHAEEQVKQYYEEEHY
ncbi:hypothetical protein BY458DRAFT_484111 [Sporodiniella umbellata]|nr:hypothetical protein BY458DRAFT_484111 [Sporodiniella umbellata]